MVLPGDDADGHVLAFVEMQQACRICGRIFASEDERHSFAAVVFCDAANFGQVDHHRWVHEQVAYNLRKGGALQATDGCTLRKSDEIYPGIRGQQAFFCEGLHGVFHLVYFGVGGGTADYAHFVRIADFVGEFQVLVLVATCRAALPRLDEQYVLVAVPGNDAVFWATFLIACDELVEIYCVLHMDGI